MQDLWTRSGTELTGTPWSEYPRPQLRRQEWLCLNGEWDFLPWEKGMDSRIFTEKIQVPFCPECLLSGIHRQFSRNTVFTYRRYVKIPGNWKGKRILLHFGAVDQCCTVTVNNLPAGSHKGGYHPFSMDVTDLLGEGENEIIVRAVDNLDHSYPWGKQKRNRGGMWYTPVSGIWQTVWLEPVPDKHIRKLDISTEGCHVRIEADGAGEGRVLLEGKEYPLRDGKAEITVFNPDYWSPEHPRLYPFTLLTSEDKVESYFALRTLQTKTIDGIPRLCLNGKPYFFHGLLDQGYWSDGLYTPPGPASYAEDILAAKALGFNTLRKHIKIEPERYYYECDRLGMIVFQDMVNNGRYSFLFDTVLPTIGFRQKNDLRSHPSAKVRERFLEGMKETVSCLKNHPCICLWTIFNEGWGQFRSVDAYERLKALDGSRWIDTSSGWFRSRKSDVESLHIYFQPLHGGKEKKPLLLSEFGGYSFKIPEHSYNDKKTYGYGKYTNRTDYLKALSTLYREQLLPLVPQGLCGAIYTQLSDVEDETNGLLTYDRAVCKISPADFQSLSEAMLQ